MMVFKSEIPYCSITDGRSLTMSRQTKGSTRFAAPTSTAVAPASIISMTSSAVETPPMPMTGTETACATW